MQKVTFVGLFLILFVINAPAQTSPSPTDAAAIKQTALDYIEG